MSPPPPLAMRATVGHTGSHKVRIRTLLNNHAQMTCGCATSHRLLSSHILEGAANFESNFEKSLPGPTRDRDSHSDSARTRRGSRRAAARPLAARGASWRRPLALATRSSIANHMVCLGTAVPCAAQTVGKSNTVLNELYQFCMYVPVLVLVQLYRTGTGTAVYMYGTRTKYQLP